MLLSNDGMLCYLEGLKQRTPVHFTTDKYIPFNLRPTSLGQGYESVLFGFFISAKRKSMACHGLE
jgi:hypothetical protein